MEISRKEIFERLSATAIFNGIYSEEVERLFSDKLFRTKNLEKEEYAANANDPCENLMFVIHGSVRGEMTDFSGKVIKIEDIVAPRPIAPAFVFGKQNAYPVDIIANEPTLLLIVPKETLIRLLQENAQVLKNFLDVVSNRTQFLSNKIRFLSFRTIKGKIASYLLKMIADDNNKIILPVTQSQLADYFGVTRPSLARGLGEMEKDGIIEINKKEMVIKDKIRLLELIK